MTRAWSRTSAARMRRTIVIFSNMAYPFIYVIFLIEFIVHCRSSQARSRHGRGRPPPGRGGRIMNLSLFVMSMVFGPFAGWLAGIAMKGGGYGLLWDIVFGLSGSVAGSWIFQTLGAPEAGWGGTGIAAFVGAALMITLQRKIWPAQVAHA